MKSLWIQGPGSGSLEYSAADFRVLITELWDPGVKGLTSFRVSERGDGPNMTVDVSSGRAVVAGSDIAGQGNYLVSADLVATGVSISSAPGSGARWDIVGLRVRDATAGGPVGDHEVVVEVVEGTPSSTPTDPSLPPSVLPLARVRVPAGTVSITSSLIDDVRVLAGRRDVPGARMETHGATPISGWLLEDGSAVSRTEHSDLFAEIGERYGPGDGVSTFNLPDSRGRSTVVANDLGSGAATGNSRIVAALGATGGAASHTLTTAQIPGHTHDGPSHTHTGPSHTHGSGTLSTGSAGAHTHSVSGSAASAGAHTHGSGTLATSSAGSHTHDRSPSNTASRWLWGASTFTSGGSGVTDFRVAIDPAGMAQLLRGNGVSDMSPATAGGHTHNISGSTGSAGGHTHTVSGTAASNGAHTHSVSGSTGSSGTGNTGASGTGATSSTGGGESHPNVHPYIAVFGWIRT